MSRGKQPRAALRAERAGGDAQHAIGRVISIPPSPALAGRVSRRGGGVGGLAAGRNARRRRRDRRSLRFHRPFRRSASGGETEPRHNRQKRDDHGDAFRRPRLRASPSFADLLHSEINEQIHRLRWRQTIPSKSDLLLARVDGCRGEATGTSVVIPGRAGRPEPVISE